jgi:hypothetical protein
MNAVSRLSDRDRYARCIRASKMVSWDIERDVIGGRTFDTSEKFLPDGLSLAPNFFTLSESEKRFVSQIQGRTYAKVFGLVERFINAKVLEVSRDYWLGDQVALEALVRFSEEELKHQALFRRIDEMIGETLPSGYRFDVDPDVVASTVLGKSTWAVLALTLDIELFSQFHYRQSIAQDDQLSELFKNVFLYHWKEESQHAILDELEWVRHDATVTDSDRDNAVDELIELQPTRVISRRTAAAQSTRRKASRSKRISSMLTGGNTSTRAYVIPISGRCLIASSPKTRAGAFRLRSPHCSEIYRS